MTASKGYTKENRLIGLAPFVLFLSSYMPLFILVAVRQCMSNIDCISWDGLNFTAIINIIRYFWVSILCVILVAFGLFGTYETFSRLEQKVENGTIVRIKEISSINEEPLAYIATYVIPILFQDYSSFTDCITIFVIFYIVYRLYIRSKLILVNPILNLKYSIYNIKYLDGCIERQGILITKDKSIYEEDKVKIYNVGYQLFFGYLKQEK